MTQRLCVLHYGDFRSFLKDYFQSIQARHPKFSFGSWSQRMGLRSRSTLVMIVNGQRNPGSELTESLIQDMKLNHREATFFRDLVSLEKCEMDSPSRVKIMERLATMHPQKTFRSLDAKTFQAISNWHFYVLRELVDLPDFREDMAWIQKRLRWQLSQKEIQEAFATLVDLGLLCREDGRLKYTNGVQSTFDIPDEGLKRFHEQMLHLASAAVRSVAVNEREISSMTFTLANQDIARAKEIMRQALYDIGRLGQNKGDEVYHVELALFPLTKKAKEKSGVQS